MSVVPKPVPMAECLNYGVGLPDVQEYAQGIIHPPPNLHDVYFKFMGYPLPSQNEKKDVVLYREDVEVNPPNCSNDVSNSHSECEDKLIEGSLEDDSTDESKAKEECITKPEVPYIDSALYFLPVNYNKRNPWRRIIGLHVCGNELRSATYPARSSVKKLRFAQAKKPLNYLYSYFSVDILDCDDTSSIIIGICRKDYPSKVAPGKNSGSVAYYSDTGAVCIRDSVLLDGPRFSKGDVVGCGIIYPPHYKRYADLSTDDNSDGMTDVVLTSLVNTNSKSMDFVCSALNLNNRADESADEDTSKKLNESTSSIEYDYYNENFVESRTQVEVYFTHNMKVVGKVLSYVPVGGFYPTVHMFSCSAINMSVDLNPPAS